MIAAAMPQRRQQLMPNVLMGTLVFLGSELTLFTGLIGSFIVLRSQYTTWPPLGQPRFPVEATAITTLILLASGVALWTSRQKVLAGQDGHGLYKLAFGLGTTFLCAQGFEWVRLLQFGLSWQGNYGGLFYAVVGTHGLHVLAALSILAYNLKNTWTRQEHGGLDALCLYWSFVVLIWPILYILVYVW